MVVVNQLPFEKSMTSSIRFESSIDSSTNQPIRFDFDVPVAIMDQFHSSIRIEYKKKKKKKKKRKKADESDDDAKVTDSFPILTLSGVK